MRRVPKNDPRRLTNACTQVEMSDLTHFSKMLAMALLLHGGLPGGMGGEAGGAGGPGEGAWPSRFHRGASPLLQRTVSLLTSPIYTCFVPSQSKSK
eukprot:COSAG02_NODE_152_length_33208_cov_13.316591_3_plen_96_part_00